MVFVILIIVSSFKFVEEEKNTIKISKHLPSVMYSNYTTYMKIQGLQYKFNFNNLDFSIRNDYPSQMDILITIWIAGLIWQEIKQVYNNGIKDYLRSWNNIVNSLMDVLYIASFGLKYYTKLVVSLNKIKVLDDKFWENAANLNVTDLDGQKEVYNTIYWLNSGKLYKVVFIKYIRV